MEAHKKVNFKRGDRFEATIRAVRIEGVYIKMPNGEGEGVVSARCWGNGKKRKVAMAALRPGNKISVVVKRYHRPSKVLNLVLPKGASSWKMPQPDTNTAENGAAKSRPHRKPIYHSIASGAVLLIDTANLFGIIGHDNAAHNLDGITRKLREWGYDVVYFIERRTLKWCARQQASSLAADTFLTFCANPYVSIVDGESDLAMLQVARSMENTICCSRDRFKDYAIEYPEIVGGPRKRSFSSVRIGEKTMLSIEGLPKAIVLEPPSVEGAEEVGTIGDGEEAKVCAEEATVSQMQEIRSENDTEELCMCRVRSILERGKIKHAIRYLGEMGKKKPEGYRAVAEILAAESIDKADGEEAHKYRYLAERMERRMRELDRREARLYAELRHFGFINGIRMSTRRRSAMMMSASYGAWAMKQDLSRQLGCAA